MKYKIIVIVFLFVSPLRLYASLNEPVIEMQTNKAKIDPLLNFDEMEEQALQIHSFDMVIHKPLHPLVVWMRRIGSPIIGVYFALQQKIYTLWYSLIASEKNYKNTLQSHSGTKITS